MGGVELLRFNDVEIVSYTLGVGQPGDGDGVKAAMSTSGVDRQWSRPRNRSEIT